MATARHTKVTSTDPATVPDWVLSFGAATDHWLSLVDPTNEPAGYFAPWRSWTWFEADRIYREVTAAWLAKHAPDLNLYDLWDEGRRRAGMAPIHQRASARLKQVRPQWG